ncbi:daptide-type RiPP biosynthesis aminotransferase [Luteipulveratus mongoliensis]|uniref:Aminotransferase n=1 Tax=Luteipulveratus mongoliensis TaxID=571913 RepID=A0A0K1JE28_9MICO|nr:daptide-type RiPP biosynthesis aminotransferase [Luteipulveratus mongoliensis]AKU14961.1 aminotransferase [Luteipulveratus mongoliensis]
MSALWPYFLSPSEHGQDELCLVSATGTRVRTATGRELLCATSGLWNVNLGYGNEAVAQACGDALRDASYLGVFRSENPHARAAADALVSRAGAAHFTKVMFTTSGGAANDVVIKLARQHQLLAGRTRRRIVVSLRDSYHGLKMGSFALTGEQLGQRMYGVDQSLVRHVPPNDSVALRALFDAQGDSIAAVVVEPVIGNGCVELTTEFVDVLLALREEHPFVLVADEVATGFGRTGVFFASDEWSGPPDVLISSKGLTNGAQATAAVLVSESVYAPFVDTDAGLVHGETQGGTAVACAAITATLSEFDRLGALDLTRSRGAELDNRLRALAEDDESVGELRGRGLFRAVEIRGANGRPMPQVDVGQLVSQIREAGVVVYPGRQGVQLIPALTYTDADFDELFTALRVGLSSWRSLSHRRAA